MAESDRKVTWEAFLEVAQLHKNAKIAENVLDNLEKKEKSLGKSMEDLQKKSDASAQGIEKRQSRLSQVLGRLSNAYDKINQSSSKYQKSLKDLNTAQEAHQKNVDKAEAASNRLATPTAKLAQAQQKSAAAQDKLASSQQRAASAQDAYDIAMKSASENADDAAKALKNLEAAHKKLEAAQKAALKANSDSSAAHERQAEAAKKSTRANDNLSASFQRVHSRQLAFQKTSNSSFGAGVVRGLTQMRSGFEKVIGYTGKFTSTLLLKIPAIGAALSALSGTIGSLAAALVGLVSAAGPLVGIFGALPGVLAGAATGLGVLFGAFRGVMGAMKAYGKTQQTTAKQARTTAKQQRDAARSVRDAQRGVRDAYENAADSAVQSQRKIFDATQRLTDAQREAKKAQADLNRAREEAIRQLEDMRRSARDAAFAEEEAVLSLADAKDALERTKTDPNANATDLARADLNYREAQARLEDARKDKVQAIKDNAEAQKAGVEGSNQVVQAQERIVQSNRDVSDAQRELTQSQQDAAKAQRDAAEAIQQALERQTDAMSNQTDAMANSTAAVDEYKAAMDKLSPAGQRFVKYLISLKDNLTKIQHTAQEGLLPGVQRGLESLMTLFPMVNRTVGNFAKIMGSAFADLGKEIASPEIKKSIGEIFGDNERAMKDFTKGFNSIVIWMIKMADAAGPLTRWLAQMFRQWADSKKNIPVAQMESFFYKTKKALQLFGGLFSELWRGLKGVGSAASGFGTDLVTSLTEITRKWADWTNSVEGNTVMKQWFEDAKPILREIFYIIRDVTKAILDLGDNKNLAPFLETLRTGVLPNLQRLFDVLSKSGGLEAIGGFLTKISEGLVKMAEAGAFGGLKLALDFLGHLFDIGMQIFKVPGIGPALSTLAAALFTFKALKFASQATGLTNLYTAIRKVAALDPSKLSGVFGALGGNRGGSGGNGGTGGGRGGRRGGGNPPVAPAFGGAAPGAANAAGQQAGRGFAQGAARTGKEIANAGRQMGNALVTALKRLLEIRSPSRLMYRLGEMVGQGFVGGVRSQFDDAALAGTGLSGAAVTGTKKGGMLPAGAGKKGGKGKATPTATKPRASAGGGRMGKVAGAAGGIGAVGAIVASFLPLDGILSVIVPLLMSLAGVILPALGAAFAAIGAPILIIVGIIAAVVTGLVLLFKNNKAFHDWVINAWENIKNAIAGAWNNYILPALKAFWSFITDTLVPIIVSLWQDYIKPAFEAIGRAIAWAWNNVIKPVFKALWGFISELLIPLVMWFWKKVIEIAFKAIGAVISWVWNNIIKPVFQGLWDFIKNVLAPVFNWLWQNVIKPAFDGIGKVINWTWNNVIKPAFDVLKKGVEGVGKVFSAVKDAIVGVWGNLASALSGPANSALRWVQQNMIDPINRFLKNIGITWQIGTIWSKPLADPTSFANVGRQGTQNKLGTRAYASGGMVGGSSPHDRADNIPAMLTAGEFVLPVRAVQSISSQLGPGYLEQLRQGKPRRYASGGFVKSVNKNPSFPWGHYPSGAVHRALDIAVPVGTPVVASMPGSVIRAGWDRTGFGNHIRLAYQNGTYMILGHLSRIVAKEGQKVAAGQLVGYSGNTGRSTGPHVHVEMRRSPYDPSTAFDFSKSWYNGSVPPFNKTVKTDNIVSKIALAGFDMFTSPLRMAANNILPKLGFPGRFMSGVGNKILDFVRGKVADFTMSTETVSSIDANAPRDAISNGAITQSKQNRSGAVLGLNSGGRVPGSGNRDTVPAMLTPGEFVLRKAAVRAIGMKNLMAINGGGDGGPGQYKNGVGYFNAGGPVISAGGTKVIEGGRYPFVNLLRMFYGMRYSPTGNWRDGFWDSALSGRIRGSKGIIPNVKRFLNPDLSTGFVRWIANVVNSGSLRNPKSLSSVASYIGMRPLTLALSANKYGKTLHRLIDPKKGARFWRDRDAMAKSYIAQVSNASGYMGRGDKTWNSSFQTALQHMLYHGMKPQYPHNANLPTPWPLTAVQTAVQQQNASNALQKEYNGYLDTFSQWGLGYLVDKLLDLGPQDGITIARAAIKDRASATAYNKSLETSKLQAGTSSPEAYKFVAFLNSSKSPGIRASARELGVPDYGVVQLWDQLVKAGRINPNLANFSTMRRDIDLFRKGLFYANGGGQVPGTGSGDTVPAMLTPGEFVLRKSAVRALGLDNVHALNNMQYFADGGMVFNPRMPSIGLNGTGLGNIAGRILGAGQGLTTVNITTTINNPVAERSTQSLNKMLRRKAAVGEFGINPVIGQDKVNG